MATASTPLEDRSSQPTRARVRRARAGAGGHERPLAAGELFFSITDEKGVITAGNEVFQRISGYPLADMLGSAHNIVRHPEMPRAVFQILWDTIQAGEPVAAYVRNLTADGAYYWVLATVVPVPGGYLSVRLAPGGPHFAAAQEIYRELRALEREIEGDDVRQRKPSIAASLARLDQLLAAAGYGSYRTFMQAALPAEVARRAGELPEAHSREMLLIPPGAPPAIVEILDRYGAMSRFLDGLIADLTSYAQIGRSLAGQSAYLKRMGDDVRLFALNAQIGASRLGEQGAALDAVARLLTEQSQATSPLVATVAELAGAAVSEIDHMTFELSLATIQSEMIAVFAHELAGADELDPRATANMVALASALQSGSTRTFAALNSAARELSAVIDHVEHVGSGVDRLARLAFNGRVELASVPDAGPIKSLFSDVDDQVSDARVRLTEFDAIVQAAAQLRLAAGHEAMHAASSLHASALTLVA